LRAAHCNQCGLRLKDDRAVKDEDGRAKLYADIAHPINSSCREMIQERVIQSFQQEIERSRLPGYVSSYDDFDEDIAPSPRHDKPRRGIDKAPHMKPAAARPAPVQASNVQPAAESDSTKKLEPAEAPRGPHKVPSHAPAGRHIDPSKPDSFGAGIL
jgi:stage V sporulation protein G